jgi:hypothetical protein
VPPTPFVPVLSTTVQWFNIPELAPPPFQYEMLQKMAQFVAIVEDMPPP